MSKPRDPGAEREREILERRRIGAQLANSCFNLSQQQSLTTYQRDSLGGLVREWDQIQRVELRAIRAPKKKGQKVKR